MIKGFLDFDDQSSVNESRYYYRYGDYNYSDYYDGNNNLSKWLRKTADNIKWKEEEAYSKAKEPESDARDSIAAIGASLTRLVVNAGAVISDFFKVKGSKKNIGGNREELLDSWWKRSGNKDVSEKGAQAFYKSAVMRGKKYFGKDFDPRNPKNEQERIYSEYIASAMGRYYQRLNEK